MLFRNYSELTIPIARNEPVHNTSTSICNDRKRRSQRQSHLDHYVSPLERLADMYYEHAQVIMSFSHRKNRVKVFKSRVIVFS